MFFSTTLSRHKAIGKIEFFVSMNRNKILDSYDSNMVSAVYHQQKNRILNT